MENLRLSPESLKSQGAMPSTSKANPATVSRGVQALFSAYRANDFADAEGFFVQAASVLSEFPEDIVLYVTSPMTGLQRRSKWPPTISEILEACEDHQDFLRKQAARKPAMQRVEPPSTLSRPPGYLANIFVPDTHPRYAKLVEWTKTAEPKFWSFEPSSDGRPGVRVPNNVWYDGIPVQRKRETEPKDLTLTPEAKEAMARRQEPSGLADDNG